jgi:hypothetical protein
MEPLRSATHRLAANIISDQDLIVVYRALDEDLCRAVVECFDHDDGKSRGKVITGPGNGYHEDKDVKSSWDLEILNNGAWADIFQRIHPKIQACVSHYLSRSPILQSLNLQATGYKIQMYPKGEGYFRWHVDSVGRSSGNRVVAMVLYLNDVEKGGETGFFHQRRKISPKAGHLALFPTGWNYMHCGHVPESSDKYIIQTFITVRD